MQGGLGGSLHSSRVTAVLPSYRKPDSDRSLGLRQESAASFVCEGEARWVGNRRLGIHSCAVFGTRYPSSVSL